MSPLSTPNEDLNHGEIIEEIRGLIKVYEDGHVERSEIIPLVECSVTRNEQSGVISADVVIDDFIDLWARIYLPECHDEERLPLVLYFHGGGFCVGSAAWSCYHDFLSELAAKSGCLIMSVNYRLAPENPLPGAYNDGLKAIMWLKEEAKNQIYLKNCDFANAYIAGDSAGANIAHHLSIKLHDDQDFEPLIFKGRILIQPFFGGEERTHSEEHLTQPPGSALTLMTSDTYWRLSLPAGSNRDHPWCKPELNKLGDLDTLVCLCELDILKDRNLEFVKGLVEAGVKVEHMVYEGVGHAFHVLNNSQLSLKRRSQMIYHIMAFINTRLVL